MEIETYIKKNKQLYSPILNFIESQGNSGNEFKLLTKIIDDQEIVKNKIQTWGLFELLYAIGYNHHRNANFFNKLGLIFQYLNKDNKILISSTELFDLYKKNKRLLLLLFEQKILIPEKSIINQIFEIEKSNGYKLSYYLFSEIKNSIEKRKRKLIENDIRQKFKESIESFEYKCKQGENDSPICKIIRQDSIDDFVSYVNKTNVSLTMIIKPDFYESNEYLISNEINLIEYAFYHGSIKIIKYLKSKHIEFTESMLIDGIHSNNLELINLLEESEIKLSKQLYYNCIIESIYCHHNEFVDYFKEKFLLQKKEEKQKFDSENEKEEEEEADDNFIDIDEYIIKFRNYYLYTNDIIMESIVLRNIDYNRLLNELTNFFPIITIPSNVNSIANYAFSGFSSLTHILFESPSSLTSMGYEAFYECASLVEITIPSSVTKIKYLTFYCCDNLKNVFFESPSSLTSIDDNAFYECVSLKQITIPSSVTNIGECAFDGCSSLKQITIPSSVTSIKNRTFCRCSSLKQISFENPSSLTTIGQSAFERCSSLIQITIPSSVTIIGYRSFWDCSSLTQIKFELPSSLSEILEEAFLRCSSLKQITIPSSMTKIGENAYAGCSLLK